MSLSNIRNSDTFRQCLLLLVVVAGYVSLTQHHLFHEISYDGLEATHAKTGIDPNSTQQPSEDNNINESCLHCLIKHFLVADVQVYSVPVIYENSFQFESYLAERKYSYALSFHRTRAPPVAV